MKIFFASFRVADDERFPLVPPDLDLVFLQYNDILIRGAIWDNFDDIEETGPFASKIIRRVKNGTVVNSSGLPPVNCFFFRKWFFKRVQAYLVVRDHTCHWHKNIFDPTCLVFLPCIFCLDGDVGHPTRADNAREFSNPHQL